MNRTEQRIMSTKWRAGERRQVSHKVVQRFHRWARELVNFIPGVSLGRLRQSLGASCLTVLLKTYFCRIHRHDSRIRVKALCMSGSYENNNKGLWTLKHRHVAGTHSDAAEWAKKYWILWYKEYGLHASKSHRSAQLCYGPHCELPSSLLS